jgi:hypothetical protein
MGTRFLPATKAVPKELLPVVDTPALEYIVAEAARDGLNELLVVTAHGKDAIADHFSRVPDLEAALEKANKIDLLASVRRSTELAQLHFIRQNEVRGLGDAVAYAETFVGGEPFAVLLGDDMIHTSDQLLHQMLDVQHQRGGVVLALVEVPREDISRYGSVRPAEGADVTGDVIEIIDLVEKPSPEVAPSQLASSAGTCCLRRSSTRSVPPNLAPAVRSSSPTPCGGWPARMCRYTASSSEAAASTRVTGWTTSELSCSSPLSTRCSVTNSGVVAGVRRNVGRRPRLTRSGLRGRTLLKKPPR